MDETRDARDDGRPEAVGDDRGGAPTGGIDTLDSALDRGEPDRARHRAVDGDAPDDQDVDRARGERARARTGRGPRRRLLVLLLVVLVLLLIAGGALLAWSLTRSDQSTTTTRTYTVSTQTLKQTVDATGTLEPAQQSDLSFTSSGTVDSVRVAVGDKVTKGQKLASIDDASLQVAVTTAEAAVADASTTLANDADADATATVLASDEADLALKRSELTQAKQAVTAATLTAPFSGTVAEVSISKGDSVAAGSSGSGASGSGSNASSSNGSGSNGSGSNGSGNATGSGSGSSSSSAITLISRGTFTVDTSVSNSDLTSIRRGLQATITPTGSASSVFGTVATIGVVASSSSSSSGSGSSSTGSGTFPVTIKVTGTHANLLPGSAVDVSITVKQLTDAIAVPTSAISTTDGRTTVRKLVGGVPTVTDVSLGQSFGPTTQVTKGLSAGDQIEITGFAAARASGNASSGTGRGRGEFGSGAGGFGGGAPAGGAGPGQGNTGQGNTGQGNTGQGNTGQGNTGQGNTGQGGR